MVRHFFAEGRHLVVDAVVTTIYRNTILNTTSTIPGYAAKQAEDRKLQADRVSSQPIATIHGGPHALVPFAMEDGGRLGAHTLALVPALAIVALDKGKRPPFAYMSVGLYAPTILSLWVQRWQQRLSTWLHLAISKHVTKLLCPGIFARLRYI